MNTTGKRSRRPLFLTLLWRSVFSVACFAATTSASRSADVDAAIVLAADLSVSINREEATRQRDGHVAALRSPVFINSVRNGKAGCIAITYFEWSGNGQRTLVLPWTKICDADDARHSASVIEERASLMIKYRSNSRTSLSYAIDASRLMLSALPFSTDRKVIDISSDGTNNDGMPVTASRDRALSTGIIVNAILLSETEEGLDTDLPTYFRANVIGGASSFVSVAETKEAYRKALLRKLVSEIS